MRMSMEAKRVRVGPAVVSVLALFLLLIAAANFQGSPEFTPLELIFPEAKSQEETISPPDMSSVIPETEPDPLFTRIFTIVLTVLGITVAAAIAVGLL